MFYCLHFHVEKEIICDFASLSVNPVSTFLFAPRGPQMFPCLTYLERNVRVDCEFPPTYQVPGPYCEYRQDSRLVGSTYPNAVIYVSIDDRRRSNVSLVTPNLCRLTWAPLADERPFTYTCRVYQGSSWKENSMAVHHSESSLDLSGYEGLCFPVKHLNLNSALLQGFFQSALQSV